MAKIPQPRWPSRTEWMIVSWRPDTKEWLPRFPPIRDRPTARRTLAATREATPGIPIRLIKVHTNYTPIPLEEE